VKVRRVSVQAGRVIDSPGRTKEKLTPEVVLEAELGAKDDLEESVRDLQTRAEELVEVHAKTLVARARRVRDIRETEKKIRETGAALSKDQDELDKLNKRMRKLEAGEQGSLPGCEEAPEE